MGGFREKTGMGRRKREIWVGLWKRREEEEEGQEENMDGFREETRTWTWGKEERNKDVVKEEAGTRKNSSSS